MAGAPRRRACARGGRKLGSHAASAPQGVRMNRHRLGMHWKQMKGRARKSAGRWTGTDAEAGRVNLKAPLRNIRRVIVWRTA